MGWVGRGLCVNAIALSGRTALFRCRRYRVLSSGRKEISCSAGEWHVRQGGQDSKIWVGGGKNCLQRKTAHEESGAAKLI